ncbi:type IV toxin-antitoxin system YeeU family antitoxin, partial [Escherichia coli]|nr:type IV toxin-antitoxin system YeeU family antitoxin [Escherichia coli]
CEADTLGSCGYVYLAVYPTPETKKQTTRITFCSGLVFSPRHCPIFYLCISGKSSV